MNEAYIQPITDQDTGLLSRNIYLMEKISVLLYYFFNWRGQFLDFAGGYGIFTRWMRDTGLNFYHNDPHTENVFAKDCEYKLENVSAKCFEAVTSFEFLEHLPDPLETIEKLCSLSNNLIFSTTLIPEPIPNKDWHYYAFEHGQHIAFYSHKTFKYIAEQFNLNYLSIQNIHILSKDKLPSNSVKNKLKNASKAPFLFSRKQLYQKIIKQIKKG